MHRKKNMLARQTGIASDGAPHGWPTGLVLSYPACPQLLQAASHAPWQRHRKADARCWGEARKASSQESSVGTNGRPTRNGGSSRKPPKRSGSTNEPIFVVGVETAPRVLHILWNVVSYPPRSPPSLREAGTQGGEQGHVHYMLCHHACGSLSIPSVSCRFGCFRKAAIAAGRPHDTV